jgi:hypothetical protein
MAEFPNNNSIKIFVRYIMLALLIAGCCGVFYGKYMTTNWNAFHSDIENVSERMLGPKPAPLDDTIPVALEIPVKKVKKKPKPLDITQKIKALTGKEIHELTPKEYIEAVETITGRTPSNKME